MTVLQCFLYHKCEKYNELSSLYLIMEPRCVVTNNNTLLHGFVKQVWVFTYEKGSFKKRIEYK